MYEQHKQYLIDKYYPLYQHTTDDGKLITVDFAVGDGWFTLLDNLSYALCSSWVHAVDAHKKVADRIGQLQYPDSAESDWNKTITQQQVDQAALVVDTALQGVPTVLQVKEKFGSLRFYTRRSTPEQRSMIYFAELMSGDTCDVCGAPGKAGGKGWIKVRCDKHVNNEN